MIEPGANGVNIIINDNKIYNINAILISNCTVHVANAENKQIPIPLIIHKI